MKKYAVIVAGGKGERFGSATPKQFLLLQGVPVLLHTLQAFSGIADEIILVLPQAQIATWEELLNKHKISIQHTIIAGGISRFQSVYNALQVIDNETSVVAIHDGVRPLVSKHLINNCYHQAILYGSAIACVPLKESIREVQGKESKALNRDNYRLIQTPQIFKTEELKNAYRNPEQAYFTDDASVMEAAGYKVNLIDGEHTNIKITHAEDLQLAETLLGK